jgi:hypothetical protein
MYHKQRHTHRGKESQYYTLHIPGRRTASLEASQAAQCDPCRTAHRQPSSHIIVTHKYAHSFGRQQTQELFCVVPYRVQDRI